MKTTRLLVFTDCIAPFVAVKWHQHDINLFVSSTILLLLAFTSLYGLSMM